MVIFGISVRCRTGFQVRKQEFIRKNGGNIMATTGYELVKESIFKEANEVSERLGKEPSNPKLLGAWEALTSVMKASALFDEYNDLRKNNSDLSWDEIERKYPEDRSEMSEEREMLFVNDCFECFEKEGFAKKFWSPFGDDKERIGQSFKVVGRCSTKDSDLSSLPMWNIKSSDGTVIGAYPEEIIPREMKENGCPLEGIE